MGVFKKMEFARASYSELEDLAELLRGEVDGRFVLCASPGQSLDDRSCCIIISPNNPAGFYIYSCLGPRAAAEEMVRERLGILQFKPKSDTRDGAQREWNKSISAARSIGEVYLRSRGITLSVPDALRFQPYRWHSREHIGPALIAGISNVDGVVEGIHQTWLASDGSGKASIDDPRKTLGEIKGGAIRLGPIGPTIGLAEGVETALSFMQASGIVTWSALSVVGMRAVQLPPSVRHVVIAADGDDYGEAAAFSAAVRFRQEGRTAEIAQAPRGKDFNDLLMERCK